MKARTSFTLGGRLSLVICSATFRSVSGFLGFVLAMTTFACGSSPEPKSSHHAEEVPANSASETRLNGDKKANTEDARVDPSEPYTTPVQSSGEAPAQKATGKVSRQECSKLFDRYIELTLNTDTRFDSVPPEMLAMLKQQALSEAAQKKGDPCAKEEVPRSKYNCAMAAVTPSQWEKCMKK
ncbi:hypothetical protein AKJ09_10798 [Labilithrix luteola]|uniref:Uncharacterized protein n=2 Tax=Labilithrix luteola TaxID=1391654 RepID=A0A0K1QFC5_9BACT|nr:hypothetical protein AKJ09_10798 [Labilithrix luteola]